VAHVCERSLTRLYPSASEEGGRRAARRKRTSMDGRQTTASDRVDVCRGRIALVRVERPVGIVGCESCHQAIASDLRNDRGCGDGCDCGVCSYNGGLWEGKTYAKSICDGVIWWRIESGECEIHGCADRPRDTDDVDHMSGNVRHGERDGDITDLISDDLAHSGREAFRIVEPGDERLRRKDDSCRGDGTGECSSPDFVDAGDP